MGIEVKVGSWHDQGFGACKASLFIYLYDGKNTEVASKLIFGPYRADGYTQGRSPSCTIGEDEPIVALAQPGFFYKLRYQNGGGGGHSITVRDWLCKLFPKDRTTDEVLCKVQ